MRCVVLGAGGFIGNNLLRLLDGKVAVLRGLVRVGARAPRSVGAEMIIGDFADTEKMRDLVRGCDTVFHLIGATTPATGHQNMIDDLERNVSQTLRFLDICVEQKVERLVFASSGGTVYGIPERLPTPEDAAKNPITSYGISKLAIEMYLELYRYHFGLDYRVLRLSNPYGPHQTVRQEHGVVAAFLRSALSGESVEIWGDGTVARDFIYIEDVVDAMLRAALHTGSARTFNIGSGTSVSIRELVSEIETVTGRHIECVYRAARPVDIGRSALDVRLAARELQWSPRTSLSGGLEKTAVWVERTLTQAEPENRDRVGAVGASGTGE